MGFAAAVLVVVLFLWAGSKEKDINPEQIAKRRENLKKVMAMARERDEIRNDDVQFALKVSDATATRYLDELERQGKLVQTGSKKGAVYRHKYGSTAG